MCVCVCDWLGHESDCNMASLSACILSTPTMLRLQQLLADVGADGRVIECGGQPGVPGHGGVGRHRVAGTQQPYSPHHLHLPTLHLLLHCFQCHSQHSHHHHYTRCIYSTFYMYMYMYTYGGTLLKKGHPPRSHLPLPSENNCVLPQARVSIKHVFFPVIARDSVGMSMYMYTQKNLPPPPNSL